jgi:hypothetical protein
MKTFIQFITEEKSLSELNQKLINYCSGAVEEYDNTGSFMDLFDPNGQGIPKLLSIYGLGILGKDGDVFTGKGALIEPTMTFQLSRENEFKPVHTLTIEISKVTDGDYMIKSAKVS